jgi:hypothetical protein
MSLTKVTFSMIEKGDANAFDFLTAAQKTAVLAYNFSQDVTSALQNAINTAFAEEQNLYVPAGGYLVTGLTLPGSLSPDTRSKAFSIKGQGIGIPYSTLNNGGTIFKSVTNAPVLQDPVVVLPQSFAEYHVSGIRFDATSTTPAVLFHSLYGTSSVSNCVVYQRGTGSGFKFEYIVTARVHDNYAFNSDFVTPSIGAGRTGIGFDYTQGAAGGLGVLEYNSARGFLTGFTIAGAAGGSPDNYAPMVMHNEASTVYNGFIIDANTNKALVLHNYLEGGDGGIGIQNLSSYTTIQDNLVFSGFAKGIEDTSTTNSGSVITGNTVNVGSVVNAICIDVTSSGAFGGGYKQVTGNSIIYTAGTAGVIGLKVSGTDPRMDYASNSFTPRAAWTGAGTLKISDQSTNGVYGLTTKVVGDYEIPHLGLGSLSLHRGATLTEADVTANNLTIPAGSYFLVTATVATTVNRFTAGVEPGRIVIFRTTNANTSFTDSAYIQTAGGVTFTGPGTITFFVDRSGADNFAYELSRTVF